MLMDFLDPYYLKYPVIGMLPATKSGRAWSICFCLNQLDEIGLDKFYNISTVSNSNPPPNKNLVPKKPFLLIVLEKC